MNYTYIVRCADDTLYTGWTNNLPKRIRMHNEKKGARYTRSRGPVELVYYESFDNKQDAQKREYAIKQLSRQKKQDLIQTMDTNKLLSSYQSEQTVEIESGICSAEDVTNVDSGKE